MIIARSPLRVSFFGGGTDFPKFYENNKAGGAVITAAINKYTYTNIRYLKKFYNHKYRIRYFKNDEVNSISEISHPIIRYILKKFSNKNEGYEIIHNSDLPGRCGLASSSSFTNSLIYGLNHHEKLYLNQNELWKHSINIERKIEVDGIGSQDQIITSLGGIKFISFKKSNIHISNMKNIKNMFFFKERCSLFYTGINRTASDIEKDKVKSINRKYSLYKDLYEICIEASKCLNKKQRPDIKNLGKLLREQWQIKKKLSNKVSNQHIDSMYEFGLKKGAIAGKILGAGNGGFFLFLSESKKDRENLIKNFESLNTFELNFNFDFEGTKIIYNS